MEASLYVHVPFCAGACDYCDFYSVPVEKPDLWSEDPRLERFMDVLLADAGMLFKSYKPGSVPTLYIGGGTPSVLGPAGIRRLLSGLLAVIARYSPPPEEVTVEANPESADEAFLAAAREGGATRLSLGVQTFHGPSRRAVRRMGDETQLDGRLALAADYFPGGFSADLISGLPLQSEKILLDDIDRLLAHKPAHVSLYALSAEPGTPLAESPAFMDRDGADRLWLSGRDALEKAGYGQYEVSNFCLSGKESRHNIRYWRMRNWLALGPAASGTVIDDDTGTGMRYTAPPDLDAWLTENHSRFPGDSGIEELDALTLMKESLLMGFRYAEGPDQELFQRRFRRTTGDTIPKTMRAWRNRGLMRKDGTALTKEGLLFLNAFLVDAFKELDDVFPAC